VGDYNNDGWNDLFVSYYGQNALFRNNGNGTFTEVTKEAGLLQSRLRWNSDVLFLTTIATATWTCLWATTSTST